MSALKRRWKLDPARGARGRRAPRSSRRRRPPRSGRDADQDRGPVRLPGRVRRRSTTRTSRASSPRCRSTPARSRRTRTSRATAGSAARSAVTRSSSSASAARTTRADKAIKETKRLMEQLERGHHDRPALRRRGDRGRELREGASDEDVRQRHRGRAGHDAEGAGAELLPLQRRRRAVERRPRRPRVQQARLEDGGGRRGRLLLRVDVGGRLHRRVLRASAATSRSGSSRRSTRPTTRRTPSRSRPNVDGTFVAVGGAGLIPFLKAYEQAHGPIDGKKFIGNVFWGTPGQFEELGDRVAGAYVGGAGTAGDLARRRRRHYTKQDHRQVVQDDPAVRRRAPQASCTFTFGYYVNTWGLIKGLRPSRATSPAARRSCRRRSAKVQPARRRTARSSSTRTARRSSPSTTSSSTTKDGKLAVKTVGYIPDVDQTFGGTFSTHDAARRDARSRSA